MFFRLVILFISLFPVFVSSTSYYVKNSGVDPADCSGGTTDGSAWKTVAKVNSCVNGIGDDVYFRCGDVWMETLINDWGGISTNRSYVDSYYMSGGSEVVGTDCSADAGKPVFRGMFNYPTSILVGGDPGAIPDSFQNAIVRARKSYTTLANLACEYSSGNCFIALGTSSSHILYTEMIGLEARSSANKSISFRYSDYGKLIDSTATKCGWANRHNLRPTGDNKEPVCITAVVSNFTVMEDNLSYEQYGECFSAFKSNSTIIRHNTIYSCKYMGVYIDKASNTIVENNLLIGTEDPEFRAPSTSSTGYSGNGISVAMEGKNLLLNAEEAIIRNNIIINLANAFTARVQLATRGIGKKMSFYFVNNTVLGTRRGVRGTNAADAEILASYVYNNIFHDIDIEDCTFITDPDVIMDFNGWNVGQPVDLDCKGNSDVTGTPSFVYTGDWKLVEYSSRPTDTEMSQADGSIGLGTGKVLTGTILNADDYPISLTKSGTLDLTINSYDFFGTLRDPINPDMGAIENSATAPINETLPYYGNLGSVSDEVADGKTYLASAALYCTSTAGTGLTTNDILNTTTHDAVYKTWARMNGTYTCNLPITNQKVDIYLHLSPENYFGVVTGTCTSLGSFDASGNPARIFAVYVEGRYVADIDICKQAGAPWTAYTFIIPGVDITDSSATFSLQKVTTEGKPQLSGFYITAAAATDVMTVGRPAASETLTNVYPNIVNIAATQIHQVTTTSEDSNVIITAITDNTTCGTAAISLDDSFIEYTVTDINQTGSCGTINITFSDGTSEDATSVLSLSLTPISAGTLTFRPQASNGLGRGLMKNQTGFDYWLINLSTNSAIPGTGETTDANGYFSVSDPRIVPGIKYRVVIMLPGWSTFGTNNTHNRIFTEEYMAQ